MKITTGKTVQDLRTSNGRPGTAYLLRCRAFLSPLYSPYTPGGVEVSTVQPGRHGGARSGLLNGRPRIAVRVALRHELASLGAARRAGRAAACLLEDGRVGAPLPVGAGDVSPADRAAEMAVAP